jgi:hypothetical protein
VIARPGHRLQLGAHRALGFVSELAEEPQNGLKASIISRQYARSDRMPDRVRCEQRLQGFDIAFCEGLVATPDNGDVLCFSRTRPAHFRFLPIL